MMSSQAHGWLQYPRLCSFVGFRCPTVTVQASLAASICAPSISQRYATRFPSKFQQFSSVVQGIILSNRYLYQAELEHSGLLKWLVYGFPENSHQQASILNHFEILPYAAGSKEHSQKGRAWFHVGLLVPRHPPKRKGNLRWLGITRGLVWATWPHKL